MGKERSIKKELREIFIKLSIRRGFSRKKLNKLNSAASHLESNLKFEEVDRIAGQVQNYVQLEEPGGSFYRER